MRVLCLCKKDCFTYYKMGSREQIFVCAKTSHVVKEQKQWFLHSKDKDFMVENSSGPCDFYAAVPKLSPRG